MNIALEGHLSLHNAIGSNLVRSMPLSQREIGEWLILPGTLGVIVALIFIVLAISSLYTIAKAWRRSREAENILHRQQRLSRFLAEANHISVTVDALSEVIAIASEAIPAAAGASVILWDGEHRRFQTAASNMPEDDPGQVPQRIRRTAGATRWIVDNAHHYSVPDISDDKFGANPMLEEKGLRSYVGVPIVVDGLVLGALYVMGRQVHIHTDEEINFLTDLSNAAAFTILRTQMHDRLAKANIELSAANRKLHRLDEIKTKFMRDMSHELRTPMTAIALYADLLRRGSGDRKDDYLDAITKNLLRVHKLGDDVSRLANLRLNAETFDYDLIDLIPLVEDTLAKYRASAEAAGLSLQLDAEEMLPGIHGDRSQLSLMIDCLVDNALSYTREGVIGIRLSRLEKVSQICLEVSDTGIGIPNEDMDLIFESFYRGQAAGESSTPGSGVGLTLVREIVRFHEGTIDVDSQPDTGSTFRICLPVIELLSAK